MTMRPSYKVTELLGDGIGEELSRAVHALADALPIQLDFEPVDLRLETRRARGKAIYDEAVRSIEANGIALKYPTITAEESPNQVLRRRLDLSVIHRPVYSIPGVPSKASTVSTWIPPAVLTAWCSPPPTASRDRRNPVPTGAGQ